MKKRTTGKARIPHSRLWRHKNETERRQKWAINQSLYDFVFVVLFSSRRSSLSKIRGHEMQQRERQSMGRSRYSFIFRYIVYDTSFLPCRSARQGGRVDRRLTRIVFSRLPDSIRSVSSRSPAVIIRQGRRNPWSGNSNFQGGWRRWLLSKTGHLNESANVTGNRKEIDETI